MESDNYPPLLTVTCRFVPYDQWFVTHVDDTWKVKQVKHWFLSKCNLIQESAPPKIHRSVSPITFASTTRTKSSLDGSGDDTYEEDEYDDDSDDYDDLSYHHQALRRHNLHSRQMLKASFSSNTSDPPGSSQATLLGKNTVADQYTLLSFSTGIILEDDFALSWYNIHPYELLELHRAGTVVSLPRDVIPDYVQPFFEAKVRALRAVWNEKSGRFESPSNVKDTNYNTLGGKGRDKTKPDPFMTVSSPRPGERKNRRAKVEWRDRWVIIHQGVLTMCKDQSGSIPMHTFPLSSSCALRGADSLARACSIITEQRVVCIKFQPSVSSPSFVSPPGSVPSSPLTEHSNFDQSRNIGKSDRARGKEKQQNIDTDTDGEVEYKPRQQPSSNYNPEDICRSEGEWLVLDMLDDQAFASILRILHRHLPYPMSSSFISSSSIVTMPTPNVLLPAITPFMYSYPYDSLPYPEWRTNITETARKAGMGDIGKPMAWVLWEENGLGDTLMDNLRDQRRRFTQKMQYRRNGLPSNADIHSDDIDTDDSELEWEGWMRDLDRQGRIKQSLESRSSLGQKSPSSDPSTSLPSPPLSDASSPDRGRSPTLTTPSATFPMKVSHSYLPHSAYSSLSTLVERPRTSPSQDVVGRMTMDMDRMTVTTSTVSVGTKPARRRSSTITTAIPAKLKKEKDKSETHQGHRSQMSAMSPTILERGNIRISTATSPKSRSNPLIRHARSGSNLQMRSTAHNITEVTSDQEGGDTDNATGSGSKKRQNGIMRGMSIRAEKFVRGLDSALEFVEGRT